MIGARRAGPSVAGTAMLPCASWVSHVFRHAEPACIERVGIDDSASDLVLVDVV